LTAFSISIELTCETISNVGMRQHRKNSGKEKRICAGAAKGAIQRSRH